MSNWTPSASLKAPRTTLISSLPNVVQPNPISSPIPESNSTAATLIGAACVREMGRVAASVTTIMLVPQILVTKPLGTAFTPKLAVPPVTL